MSKEGTDSDSQFVEEANGDGEIRKSSSPRESPPTTDLEEKATHVRFLLSNAEAGSVIGKGGSTINDFKAKSGARIQLSRTFETFPGTSDRIVLISGAFDDVLKAVDLIMSKLLEEFYAEEEDVDPRFHLKMIVPNGSCGGIIGKGGSTIKSFIEESKAYIKISPLDNSYPGLYDRLVTVNGNLGEQMRAIELILLKLNEDTQYTQSVVAPYVYAGSVQRYNGVQHGYNGVQHGANGIRGKSPNDGIQNKGHLQEDRNNSVVVSVPDEHIGLVVGRGGRNIAEISQVSGARIKISDRGDFMSGTSNRKVTITGSQRSIHVAETMISGKLSSLVIDE